ncbi:alpha-2-macroglobulin family protein [Aureispira sp. CCB-E]|uniref:alpha-2-macroglobulin family protein n=1 Tax=Aureispira sp. CCB-E TaxID=3051121 RepID=UPI0028694EE8|nr:alpha-2-macroglobulin family protein [Aureispira sp. CCB-E]WMX15424.1 alpha-2-macroglobulin family protein [Aureispira sp. CCB-E]
MKSTTQKIAISFLIFMMLGIGLASAIYNQPNILSNHPFLKNLVEKLALYQEQMAEDKVYLQFDKTFYEPGESIWFTAYVRDARTFQASDKSEVVYVELLSPKGSVEQTLTLIAQEGQVGGAFDLAASLKGGLYTIKAYTQWQKNTNAFFERDITVQKSVLPNLNMKLNFDKKAYGVGAAVIATLDLNTLTKKALVGHAFDYVVNLEGKRIKAGKGKTNNVGRAYLKFNLPQKLATNDGLLNVMIQYKGQTESIARSIPIVLGNIDLAFYPEGGDLITGMNCGVGFKALDEFGKPADVEGHIVDQEGRIVTTFDSYHQGMGQFEMTAQKGQQYTAKITSPAFITKEYPLPVALDEGYALKAVTSDPKHINLGVISSKEEELYVVVQSRHEVQYSKVVAAQKGLNTLSIPTTNFPVGIAQVTLFSSDKIARAERLIFVNPNKQLNVEVITNKEKYLPREKVEMSLKVTNELGQPVSGDFSLAVVDDKLLTFADDKQGHLLSYMLLESDLKGEVVEPNFYFDDEKDATRLKPNIDRKKALDHLMMTQGWRKFAWKEIIAESYQAPTQTGELARIGGTVLNEKREPVSGIAVELMGKDVVAVTDQNGRFSINNWKLFESVNLQTKSDIYYPVLTSVLDYNNDLTLQVYKKRVITGVVKNSDNKVIANAEVRASGITATKTNGKGVFSLTIPNNITALQVYGAGYRAENIILKEGENVVNVMLDEALIVATRATAVNRGGVVRVFDAPEAVEEFEEVVMFDGVAEPLPEPEPAPMDDVALIDEDVEGLIIGELVLDKEDLVLEDLEMKKNELEGYWAPQITGTRYQRVREFPVVTYEKESVSTVRTDFRSTVYWNPSVRVGADGKAQITFYNNDAITQFRVTIEGFGDNGGLGRTSYTYFTQLPFEMLTKVPKEVLTGDQITIPLTLTNNRSIALKGNLSITLPTHIQLLEKAPTTIHVTAEGSKKIALKCLVLDKVAEGDLLLGFEAEGLKDQLLTTINARPRGFPVHEVVTGDKMRQEFSLTIQEQLEGSLVAKLQAYPNTLDEVMKGMENMLRMPHGCFEQTSSSNYPNLLVLDYLRETGMSLPQIEKQAMEYLDAGYKRLVGYESPSGGFDWWGRDPGHEALSAYGLMEFVDMKRVYDVDKELIDRTAKWLLSRKDGKGSWNKNQQALHSWAVAEVTDAYIVWAVAEAGYSDKITKELDKSYKDAVKSEDPYMMALVANALFKAKDKRATTLVKELAKLQQKDGRFVGLTSSVTNSTGQSLMIETSSLAVLAMLQAQGYDKAVQEAIKAIQSGKNYYGYGSTQGTVLALKAMLEYAKNSKKAAEPGELVVSIDGQQVATVAYTEDQSEVLIPNLGEFLKDGKQNIVVEYKGTKVAMPWDLEVTYTTRLPQNSPNCPLSLHTTLPKNEVKMGETIRLTTTLSNTSAKGQPMAMAMVGIPAGLSLQPWQLKELQEKKIVDYYELFDGYAVFHYEQLEPNQTKTIQLDLKADVPGTYEAPASSAFLYYTNEDKVWAKPKRMIIQ